MLDETKPLRLRFESHDDALDFANEFVERANRWLAVNDLNAANHYMRGDGEIHIAIRVRPDAEEFHLVLRAVPDGGLNNEAAAEEVCLIERDGSVTPGNRGDDSVFIGVTEGVKCPEKIVPSFVWLERAKECRDFFGKVFTLPLYGVFKMSGVFGKGEVCVTPGKGEHKLVKGRAHVNNGVTGDAFQPNWHGLDELVLINV